MTKIEPMPLRCAVCGYESEQLVLLSTSTFGVPDLDTRPAELARSTLAFSVQSCPACGYSAESLEHGGVERGLLESPRYRQPLDVEGLPDLALRLLRAATVAAAKGDEARAGWAALRAAWACDDQGADAPARACRERAVEHFRRAERFAADRASEHAILADLLRRAGRFADAIAEADAGLGLDADEVVRNVLQRQRTLSRAGDVSAHTVPQVDATR